MARGVSMNQSDESVWGVSVNIEIGATKQSAIAMPPAIAEQPLIQKSIRGITRNEPTA
jgi:hypothetical protein